MKVPYPSVLAGAFLCALLPACSGTQPALFNDGLGLQDEITLVVPFSDPKGKRWYGESEKGQLISTRLRRWAEENWQAEFAQGESAEKVLESVRDWEKPEIWNKDWQKLTASLGVTCVVVGEIQSIRYNPQMIGIIDASVKVSFRVIDVSRGRTIYENRELEKRSADTEGQHTPDLDLGGNRDRVEKRLLTMVAEEIGKELYGYTHPDSW